MIFTDVAPEALDKALHKEMSLDNPNKSPFLSERNEIVERDEPDLNEREKQTKALEADVCDKRRVVDKKKRSDEQRAIVNSRLKAFKRDFQNAYPPPPKKRSSTQAQEPVATSSRTRSGARKKSSNKAKSSKTKSSKKRTIKKSESRK